MSSLTAQLAGIKSNSNATILDKSKRKKIHSVSLVFEAKEAAQQDYETIYYICIEKFREMELVDSRYSKFAKTLFSETSIRFDRQVQDPGHAEGLNYTIKQFFMLNAAYLHLSPSLYCLEWLIRRFQVHIINSEELLLSVLSSYQSPEFVRVLDVIPVANYPPMFRFLLPCKKNNQNPSRNTLIRILSADKTLFQVLDAYFEQVVAKNYEFNRIIVFWSSFVVWVLMSYKEKNDSSILDIALPTLSKLVVQTSKPNVQIAVYTIFVVLCSQFALSQDVSDAVIATITDTWSKASRVQGLACISQLVRYSYERLSPLTEKEWTQISSIPSCGQEIINLTKAHSIGAFAVRYSLSLLKYAPTQASKLLAILQVTSAKLSTIQLKTIILAILQNLQSSKPVELVEWLLKTYPDVLNQCLAQSGSSLDQVELQLQASLTQMGTAESEKQTERFSPVVQQLEDESVVIAESSNLALSTAESFLCLDTIRKEKVRFELWVKASSCKGIHADQLLSLMGVSSSAEPSFLAAVAASTLPVLCRQKALEIFAQRCGGNVTENLEMLLPCLLSLFADPSSRIRRAVVGAIAALETTLDSKSVWGAKFVYGNHGAKQIKPLSRSDLKAVYKHYDGFADECVLDPNQIGKLIGGVGKTSWIEFLISHALSAQIPMLVSTLLTGLGGHKGVVKELQDLFASWLKDRPRWVEICDLFRFPLGQLDASIVNVVQTSDKVGISFLKNAICSGLEPLSELAGKRIASLWSKLKADSQNQLFDTLLDVTIDNKFDYDPIPVLQELSLTGANFAEILNLYKSSTANEDSADTKRRRRRSSSSVNRPISEIELHLNKVTVLLELLEEKIPSMAEPMLVFNSLFDVLNELVTLTSSKIPVLYTQGLVANCLILLLDTIKTKKLSKEALGSIRVDVLVNCIRTSTNFQVQNKLLLLVASLAPLCPDLVFHSVMPIFTFMGANTVRLDNDYSAFVIQQTISKVIPALIQNGDKVDEIEIALHSFVAAFLHIPRHRRNKLFGALVDTLGPQESLYKLMLLLGQKYADCQNRKKLVDAKAIIHFTTPFLRSFDPTLQLQAVEKYISAIDSDSVVSLLKIEELTLDVKEQLFEFLALTFGNDTNISGTQPLFVHVNAANGGVIDEESMGLCSKMIELLLKSSAASSSDEGPIYVVLSSCLELLPTHKFVSVMVDLANKEVPQLKLPVLELVGKKFEFDSANQSAAVEAAVALQSNLEKPQSILKNEVIDAMDTIFNRFPSLDAETQLSFAAVLCGLNGILSENIEIQVSAINAINTISRNIGARIIGLFPKILPVLFAKCQQSLASSDRDSQNTLVLQTATMALVSGFYVRIPTFMSSCTATVLELVFSSNVDLKSREKLLELVGEKIDPQTILNAYISTWDCASNQVQSIEMFFRHLDAVIENTPKKLVGTRCSQLFGMLLKCYTIRSMQRFSLNEVNHLESLMVASTVKIVLKLNDKVFRPQFLRMSRWSFEGEGTIMAPSLRHVVFMKFVVKLLGQLKSIVTNYYGYILDNVCKILETSDAGDDSFNVGLTIIKLIYQSLIFSFASDSDDFWQSPSRFNQIKNVLLAQIVKPEVVHGNLLVKAIVALAETSSSQEHRKEINDGLGKFMLSSCSSSTKIWATRVLSAIYVKLGEEWVTSLPQLVPLIAELLDDDDEEVENEVRTHLVPVIEDVLGESLDRYIS